MKSPILFLLFIICFSCSNDDEAILQHEKSSLTLNELIGTWFSSRPIVFAGLQGAPAFERGETHHELTFGHDGEFERRYTVLGFYENQNPTDSTSVRIDRGSYIYENQFLSIEMESRTYISIFDGDTINRSIRMVDIINSSNHRWSNVTFTPNDSLKFTYYTIGDEIHPDQPVPGVDFKEEFYIRK